MPFRYRFLSLLALLWLASAPVQAADLLLSDRDCRELLAQHAAEPGSVPARIVADCREQLAAAQAPAAAPAAGTAAAPAASADPCAGPNAAQSVFCWGPWAGLAPAAAGEPLPDNPVETTDYEQRPELAAEFDNEVEPLDSGGLPLGSCAPGAPCGFATVVAGTSSSGPAEDTRFARFELATDGSRFTLRPTDGGRIDSVTGMQTRITGRPDQFENLTAGGSDGDERSRLVARILRDPDEILLAADIWGHGNAATAAAQSGYFAWGRAVTQADLDALNSGGVTRSLAFSGPMSVDNATIASLQLDFGPRAGWSGSWDNPAWSFSAGGRISGANFVSEPGRFSGNVRPGGLVQGALLGTPASRAVAHIIDVQLENIGRVRDVGLLPEVAGPPVN